MKAAIFHGNRRITIEQATRPVAGPGEVLLKVRRTALCGSDAKLWVKGAEHTPGHEIFGIVEQPGHRLHARRCLVYIPVHCGDCASCRMGDTQMCLTISALVGWNRPGGYAEYLSVPEQCLLEVPDDIPDELAPLLLDTIGTAAHGIRFVQPLVPPTSTTPVLVMGAGPVGIGAVLALRDMGYRDIHVADMKAERRRLAESFGAIGHPVGDPGKRFGLIVECSGAHAARSLAMQIVLPRGVMILIGENDNPWLVEETKATRRKDFLMVRTFYFPKADYELNLGLLRRHTACYRQLVDAQFDIDALPVMFDRFVAGDLIKPLLAFA